MLTPEQSALVFFITQTLKHAFYWVLLYEGFATDEGMSKFK